MTREIFLNRAEVQILSTSPLNMAIQTGLSTVKKVYVGQSKVRKIYQGMDEIFNGLTPTLFMSGQTQRYIYTLSTSTGNATRVGSQNALLTTITGMTSHNGVLYAVNGFASSSDPELLYSVNPSTGVLSRVAQISSTSRLSLLSIVSHGGVLYVFASRNQTLYTLNPTTGAVTSVGVVNQRIGCMASHNGILYGARQVDGRSNLYTINISTGAATVIGGGNNMGQGGRRVAFVPTGMASLGGTLYMVARRQSVGALYRVDTTAGTAIQRGTAAGFGLNENAPYGLATHEI